MTNGQVKMYDIVSTNPRFLLVLEYFNIPLGFGDQTIQEICKKYNINEQLFLTISNLYCCKEAVAIDACHFDKSDAFLILEYLKAAHVYFLDEKIPRLKEIIEKKIANSPEEKYTKLVNKFVHDYADEVFEHMNYENTVVFPYINSLLQEQERDKTYNMEQFRKHHTNIEIKLVDLKTLLIKHVPPEYDSVLRRQLLFELYDLERDINIHDFIENWLLIPIVEKLEK